MAFRHCSGSEQRRGRWRPEHRQCRRPGAERGWERKGRDGAAGVWMDRETEQVHATRFNRTGVWEKG